MDLGEATFAGSIIGATVILIVAVISNRGIAKDMESLFNQMFGNWTIVK